MYYIWQKLVKRQLYYGETKVVSFNIYCHFCQFSSIFAISDAIFVNNWHLSGTVLNAIASGVKCTRLKYSAIPKCVVIPMADTSILPQQQLEFALSISATIFQYDDMSHVGPLLGTRCTEVVEDLAKWIKVTATTHCWVE